MPITARKLLRPLVVRFVFRSYGSLSGVYESSVHKRHDGHDRHFHCTAKTATLREPRRNTDPVGRDRLPGLGRCKTGGRERERAREAGKGGEMESEEEEEEEEEEE